MKKKSKKLELKKRIDDSVKPTVLDISRLSFSSISTFQRCPRQFYYRYVLGIKSPPAIALIEGSSHHAALEMNNRHKMEKGVDLSQSTITEKFMEELRTRTEAEEKIDWEGEGEDEIYRRGRTWHQIYMNDFAPNIHPDMVEEKFEKDLKVEPAGTISGVIDLGYMGKVSDYKTTSGYGLSMKKRSIDHDLQLSLYAWAAQRADVEQICLVKKDNPEVVALTSTRTRGHVAYALAVARQVLAAIRKFGNEDVYPMCAPDNFLCCEKYCGYWKNYCRGKIQSGEK